MDMPTQVMQMRNMDLTMTGGDYDQNEDDPDQAAYVGDDGCIHDGEDIDNYDVRYFSLS